MASDPSWLWASLAWPLIRILAGMAAGLFLANLLESLGLCDFLARFAKPLTEAARLGPAAAPAFALAAVSPAAASAALAESYANGSLSAREVILAHLLNSLPVSLSHVSVIFFIIWPVLGSAAFIYAGITLLAALGRTIFTIFISRMTTKENYGGSPSSDSSGRRTAKAPAWPPHDAASGKDRFFARFKKGLAPACRRFLKRLPGLFYYTVPFYLLIYFINQAGLFGVIEKWLAARLDWLDFLKPQAMSIVALQIVAETGAGLGAAAALLETGGIDPADAALAMLTGNILATPVRTARRQFPVFAGLYKPSLALKIVAASQTLRALSLLAALLIYAYY